jgi:pSer/pThr/pTyr-binding forkhead associated (FHA) protein
MARILIKHLTGARANQEESFALDQVSVLTVGRDPSCTIRFDPDADDLVSRNHARIERDASVPGKFRVVDNSSRNGVFVNNARIAGTVNLGHGDVVRLGSGGPEFQFKLDPPPADALKATRLAEVAVIGKPTREAPLTAAPDQAPRPIGRQTVERMLGTLESTSKRRLINWVAAVIGVVVLVSGGLVWYQKYEAAQQKAAEDIEKTKVAAAQARLFDPARVAAEFGGSTVFIDAAWKLVHTVSKKTVYLKYQEWSINGEARALPVYVQLRNGVIEPMLVLNDSPPNRPVGGRHSGTGFVVQENGYILTNRHVAATWRTAHPELLEMPGILAQKFDSSGNVVSGTLINDKGRVAQWVPAQSQQVPGGLDPKKLVGDNLFLTVTFAKSNARIEAHITRLSDEGDAALIKIDTPKVLKPVELAPDGADEELKPGQPVVVLGYPGISPRVFVGTESQDPFNRNQTVDVVPDNTVSIGAIGRMLRGAQKPTGGTQENYFSEFGDMIQLTINSTGPGNSGGPVFDNQGRVIGIFTAGGGGITFAAPIKYGRDLMGIKQIIK